MTVKPKHQRLALALTALIALVGAAMLAMLGLKDRTAFFATPADIAAGDVPSGKAMRLGGMVENGSLEELPDGVTIRFAVVDGEHRTFAEYRGIPPSLFREGSGVVAEGRLRADGTFAADNILAKHDERYMPPQLGNEMQAEATKDTVER